MHPETDYRTPDFGSLNLNVGYKWAFNRDHVPGLGRMLIVQLCLMNSMMQNVFRGPSCIHSCTIQDRPLLP